MSELKPCKITFAREPRPTGLSAIAAPHPNTAIKVNRKVIGMIYAPSRFGRSQTEWSIGVMITRPITDAEPAGWAWVFFKQRHPDEALARQWIEARLPIFAMEHELYQQED